MGRKSFNQHMEDYILEIKNEIQSYGNLVCKDEDIQNISSSLRDKGFILKTTPLSKLIIFMLKNKIIESVDIELPNETLISRYCLGNVDVYQVISTLNKQNNFSHFSAAYINNLTEQIPKRIYINKEQPKKLYSFGVNSNALEQKNIDSAFAKPMRKTNQIGKVKFKNNEYEIYFLSGKNHSNLGVGKTNYFNTEIRCSNIERTLIDITIRPEYAGGVNQVLEIYENAKGKFSVNKLLAMYRKMSFIYPYHQAIGFYLEKASYSEDVLKLLKQFSFKYDFYLTYQMKEKSYSDRWKIYYPKGLDSN